jgi:hypothetical protein
VVFLIVIISLAAYICRHRRRYAATTARGANQSISRSGLSASTANSNVIYMQKFPLGGAAVGHKASFHQLKVHTSPLPASLMARGPLHRFHLAAVSSSSATSGDSAVHTNSPARTSSEMGGGGSGSERSSYATRGGGNSRLEAVNYNNVMPLPIIGEENPDSVLSSTTYQQFRAATSHSNTAIQNNLGKYSDEFPCVLLCYLY